MVENPDQDQRLVNAVCYAMTTPPPVLAMTVQNDPGGCWLGNTNLLLRGGSRDHAATRGADPCCNSK